jgi:hypothetical protein
MWSFEPVPWTAILAAIAACFSAVAAIFSFRINRRNLMEQVRPWLIVPKWESSNDSKGSARLAHFEGHVFIQIPAIKNVGKGPALDVGVTIRKTYDRLFTLTKFRHPIKFFEHVVGFVAEFNRYPTIESQTLSQVNFEVGFDLELARDPKLPEVFWTYLLITVDCKDVQGNEHQVRYNLSYLKSGNTVGGSQLTKHLNFSGMRYKVLSPWGIRIRNFWYRYRNKMHAAIHLWETKRSKSQ